MSFSACSTTSARSNLMTMSIHALRFASSDFFGEGAFRGSPSADSPSSAVVARIMSDFIMTLSSDDEGPAPAAPSTKAGSSKKKAAASSGKLTRKEQLAQKKGKGKAPKKGAKRKAFDQVSEEEDDDEESAMAGPGDDEAEKMASDFVFDGLGGGFVGDRRNNVWVSWADARQVEGAES